MTGLNNEDRQEFNYPVKPVVNVFHHSSVGQHRAVINGTATGMDGDYVQMYPIGPY
jgi:hypothetical protein